jgi:predicted nucleotidyltransferase
MGDKGMATRFIESTSFWQRLRNGPWDKPVVDRIKTALDAIGRRFRESEEVVAVVVFGSYARGDFGRKSDLDLLILIREMLPADQDEARRRVVIAISEIESEARLPVHIAPIAASTENTVALGESLLHEIITDGVILYGETAALTKLKPSGLAPWAVVRFSLKGTLPKERVRLARRLHGTSGRPGIIRLPGLDLARGAALVPAEQIRAVRAALDDAGATYDIIPIWREA